MKSHIREKINERQESTADRYSRIRAMHAGGMNQTEIAKALGLSKPYVGFIVNGKMDGIASAVRSKPGRPFVSSQPHPVRLKERIDPESFIFIQMVTYHTGLSLNCMVEFLKKENMLEGAIKSANSTIKKIASLKRDGQTPFRIQMWAGVSRETYSAIEAIRDKIKNDSFRNLGRAIDVLVHFIKDIHPGLSAAEIAENVRDKGLAGAERPRKYGASKELGLKEPSPPVGLSA